MRRLNVDATTIEECIRSSKFALPYKPQSPELQQGEYLLLQLNKDEARKSRQLDGRINYALVFDYLEHDPSGALSRHYWPNAGKEWPWIVHCSTTLPARPFSLEHMSLPSGSDYSGQTNPRYIHPADEEIIRGYIGTPPQFIEEIVKPDRPVPADIVASLGNQDRIAQLRPPQKKTTTVEQSERNPWLADTLKALYQHRCQLCGNTFGTDYGVKVADTHHIEYLRNGGLDISTNIIVL